TYAELDRLADRAAAGFAGLGIAPAERVLLDLPNSCQFAVALFGLLRAGAIPVMCLPAHRLAELDHFAQLSGAVGLVVAETATAMAEQLVAAHPRLRHVVVDGAPGPFISFPELVDTDRQGDPPGTVGDTTSPALLL